MFSSKMLYTALSRSTKLKYIKVSGNINSKRVTYKPKQEKDSKGEVECRRVLESLFKKPFTKDRPDFLCNHSKLNLELDCYNQELKIAVEYQGKQHYKEISYFHLHTNDFRKQQERDVFKRQQCKKHGVNLIEVPYTINIKDIEKYILNMLG